MIIANAPQQQWFHCVLGPLQFRAVPGAGQFAQINAVLGSTFYTPKQSMLIKTVQAWTIAADPLVGAGGATALTINVNGGAGTVFVVVLQSTSIASYNALAFASGAPINSPTTVQQSDVMIHPAGALSSLPGPNRVLTARCDAGTITGTLFVALEWRPLGQEVPAP